MLVGFIAIIPPHAFSTDNMIFSQNALLLLLFGFECIYQQIAQFLRRRDLVPLTGGVKFRIAVAPAVVFFFGDLACFQLGGNCTPCGKHPVKLRCVASFMDMNAQMHLILTLADLKTVAVFQREQRVHQSGIGVNVRYVQRLGRNVKRLCQRSGHVRYSSDYDIVARLKTVADSYKVTMVIVHHTRKLAADDKFDMIAGTNGLLGAADGGFVLSKEKRTSNAAVLDVTGRDQEDQRLHLTKNPETLVWELESVETELWQEPPDPFLESIAAFLSSAGGRWEGTASELCSLLKLDCKPNV